MNKTDGLLEKYKLYVDPRSDRKPVLNLNCIKNIEIFVRVYL